MSLQPKGSDRTQRRLFLLKLATPALLLVAALAITITAPFGWPRVGHAPSPAGNHARLSSRAHAVPAATPPPRSTSAQPASALPSSPPPPAVVADRFARAWVACIYHQRPCSPMPSALPLYAAALARHAGDSLPAPAELITHPHVESLSVTRSCADVAVARITYAEGNAGRFQLHVNLVRERAGWRVFDVAEAQPHIPLPPPLGRGPRGC